MKSTLQRSILVTLLCVPLQLKLFAQCGTAISASTTITHANCTTNGKITVGASGGGGTYLYSIIKTVGTPAYSVANQASNVFTGLTAGTYSITIADQCTPTVGTTTLTGRVVNNTNVTLGTLGRTIVNPTCNNPGNGTVTATLSGGNGTPPVMYILKLGSTIVAGPQTATTFSGLSTGNYTLEAQDTCGNIRAVAANLTYNNLTFNADLASSDNQFTSNGGSSGSAPEPYFSTVASLARPYAGPIMLTCDTLVFKPQFFYSTNNNTNMVRVRVKDSLTGITFFDSTFATNPATTPTIKVVHDRYYRFYLSDLCDDSVSFLRNWNDSTYWTISQRLLKNCNGPYMIVRRTFNTNTNKWYSAPVDTITIINSSVPNDTLIGKQRIVENVGTSPFSNVQAEFYGAIPGRTYTIQIKNLCRTTTISQAVLAPSPFSAVPVLGVNGGCVPNTATVYLGKQNYSIDALRDYLLITNGPASYIDKNNNTVAVTYPIAVDSQSNASQYHYIEGLVAGTYTYKMWTNCDDTISGSFTINTSHYHKLSATAAAAIGCSGNSSITLNTDLSKSQTNSVDIVLYRKNSSGNYVLLNTYSRQNNSIAAVESFTGLTDGEYKLVVVGTSSISFKPLGQSCDTFFKKDFNILYVAPAISNNSYGYVCTQGGNDGIVKLKTQGGLPTYKFERLDPTTNAILAAQYDSVFTGLSAGTYRFRVKDTCGNANTKDLTISASGNITGSPAICEGTKTKLTAPNGPAAKTPWISSNTTVATVNDTGLVTGITSGTVAISFTDSNGCTRIYNMTINPKPTVSAGLDKSICQLDTIATVFVSGANAGGYTNLSWSTYNGTGTFANNTTANVLTTTTYDPTTADHNAVPPGANLVLTAMSANGCVASDTMRLNIRTTYTWTGATSEDFGTASNWQLGCVPPQYASINFAPDVVNICKLDQHRYLTNITNDSNAHTAKNILNLNGKRLTVVGQLNYPTAHTTGKINAENALDTMEFRGVSPFYLSPANQMIPAHLFTNKTVSNLRFDNTAGVREQDSIFITHTLQPVNGTWNTAGQLTLRSTANLTARVTPIANTAVTTINGNVIIERFIQSDTNRAWRLLSACIQPATAPTIFQSWQENMRATTGASYQPGYGTFVSRPGAGITNGYDSSSIATSLQYWDGMNLVTPMTTNTSTEKLTGHGGAWFLFVRGDKNLRPELYPAQSTTTLRQTGILNQGAVTVGQPGASYSLIPNPYASPVDLEAVGTANNLNTFYIWDAKMNTIGGYRTLTKSGVSYIATPSTGNTADDDNLRYLQSGQGFMIPGNQQLNFTEAMKTGNNFTHSVYKIASADPQLETELYNVNNPIVPQLVDGVRLYLDDSYSNQVAANEDVTKPENINENLAIGEGIQSLVISKRQEPTTADTIQLKFWKTALSSYEFAFKPHHIGSNLSVSLIDKYTNIVTPISTTTNTAYNFTITNAIGSRDVNRFMITLNQNNPLRLTGIRLKAEKQADGAKVTWSVASQKGVVQYEVERSADGKAFEKVQVVERKVGEEATTYTWIDVKEMQAKLYYRIKGTSADKDYVYSNIAQLSEGIRPGTVHIYPNPVTTQTLTLTLSDLAKGSYAMELYSEQGQKMHVTTLNHQGGTLSYEVKLGNELATGNYMLKLMHGNKAVFTQKLVITKQ